MIILGDCLEELKAFPSDKFDSMVTDPPAGISFMGKEWDSDKGGSEQWIAWLQSVMEECLRVLKPGAHALIWALPRTSHRTATALEQAGFEIRDVVVHIFGSGFPKSMDISKAIDKATGAEREILGVNPHARPSSDGKYNAIMSGVCGHDPFITAPATDDAKQWEGWGTALKPANEHWILVRKPLSEKTVAKNVLKHGTGGLNIDASRINLDANDPNHRKPSQGYANGSIFGIGGRENENLSPQGRFPANLILSHHADCELLGAKEVANQNARASKSSGGLCETANTFKHRGSGPWGSSKETVPDYRCHDECAVAKLDRQSGQLKSGSGQKSKNRNSPCHSGGFKPDDKDFESSTGGASRFFYCAKASKRDKGQDNTHPTVKSTKLMEYLIKLITPPEGLVLDPFAGSGSTGVAAKRAGFGFVGIEKNSDYHQVASKRLAPYDDIIRAAFDQINEHWVLLSEIK